MKTRERTKRGGGVSDGAVARAAFAAALAGALVVGAAGGGCASGVDQRADAWGGEWGSGEQSAPVAAEAGGQAGSWELVFATPDLERHLALDTSSERPEAGRRDLALNPRTMRAVSAADGWPEPDRPSLTRYRRIPTRDTGNSSIFFLSPSDGRRRNDPGWWY